MSKTYITVENVYGLRDKIELLFTFGFLGKKFAVYRDENELYCGALGWNFWHGILLDGKAVSEEVQSVAGRILERSAEKPQKYECSGEHYEIREAEKGAGRTIRKCAKLEMIGWGAQNAPTLVRAMLLLVISGAYAYCLWRVYGTLLVSAFFPNVRGFSALLLMIAVACGGALLKFFVSKDNRNILDLLIYAISPLNMVAFAIALKEANWLRNYILIGIGVFVAIRLAVMIKNRTKTRTMLRKAVRGMQRSIVGLLVFCVALSFASELLAPVYDGVPVRADVDRDVLDEEYRLALQKIDESTWKTLTVGEQVEVLQAICNYECIVSHGCDAVAIEVKELTNEAEYGSYTSEIETITINLDLLESKHVSEVLTTLLHETRHVWQHRIVSAFEQIEDELSEEQLLLSVFRDAAEFRANFANYETGNVDYEAYYVQYVEVDSREWSEYRYASQYAAFVNPEDGEV